MLDFLPQRGLIRLFTFSFRNEPRAEGLYFKTVLAVSKRKVKRKSMGKEKAFSFSKFADITKKLPLSFFYFYTASRTYTGESTGERHDVI